MIFYGFGRDFNLPISISISCIEAGLSAGVFARHLSTMSVFQSSGISDLIVKMAGVSQYLQNEVEDETVILNNKYCLFTVQYDFF